MSAEAGIRLSQMRSGSMSEQDWHKIVRRMSEISDAPLFIDDSPNMTMIQIRAKARRLKQRNDLRLIVVDYRDAAPTPPRDVPRYPRGNCNCTR